MKIKIAVIFVFMLLTRTFAQTIVFAPTDASSSLNTHYGVEITPILSQTGTAGYTALYINESGALGSGTQLLENLAVGGTSEMSVDASGNLVAKGTIISSDTTASTSTGTGAIVAAGGLGVAGAIYAGSVQNTPIGSTTASTGAFTTVTASGNNGFSSTGMSSPTAPTSGQGYFGGNPTYGSFIYGQGSTYDFGIFNKNGAPIMDTPTGTQNVIFNATTTSSSTTTGVIVDAGGLGVAGAIYAGAIENTPIGGTTPNVGNFTNAQIGLSGTGTATYNLNMVSNNGANTGPVITFIRNTTAIGFIGSVASIDGGVSGDNDLLVRAQPGDQLLLASDAGTALTLGLGQVATFSQSVTATAFNISSDERLKENFAPVTNALATINHLKVWDYDFIKSKDKHRGFKAQDLVNDISEAVTPGDSNPNLKEGDPGFKAWGVDYAKIVPTLVAALQEEDIKLKAAEAKIARLEGKLSSGRLPSSGGLSMIPLSASAIAAQP